MKQRILTSGQPFFGPHYAPETFGGRAPPGPAGGAHSAPPDPLAALRGPLRGREGRGGEGREGKGKGGERKERGREGEREREGKGKGPTVLPLAPTKGSSLDPRQHPLAIVRHPHFRIPV
jgi:hypothetical protein